MKTTTLFLILLITIPNSLWGGDKSTPFIPSTQSSYSGYKNYELPLPEVYLDRKTRPPAWIYKKYGTPPLPSGKPNIYQFFGRTTTAATYGEWFHLRELVYPTWITRPDRYVTDFHGNKRRLVNLTIEIRFFPESKKPPVVYDAYLVVGLEGGPKYSCHPGCGKVCADLLGTANPAFPVGRLDPKIVKIFAPYINGSRTTAERASNQQWALEYIKKEKKENERGNEEARKRIQQGLKKALNLFSLQVNKR